ncbi:MAG: NAD(P)-binding protein, partial [Tissierellia bacterium]|nr:NAD(P)-binding protein [Tissierellia bacterium]
MERKPEKFQDQLKNCMQNEPPFCTAACPFHLNIKEFIPKIQRGGFNSAYRTYLNSVGFPVIVSELCHEPCKNACPRKTVDDSINIKMIEKASIEYAKNLKPNNYNLPKKNKRIAIIGAGISGLACTLRLSSKKYEVTVFEKTGKIGGNLWNLMAPELFLDDIKRQFMYEEYNLILNREITDLDNLNFDALYVATGKDGNSFGLRRNYEGAYASNKKGVFFGGELSGKNTVEALADGLNAAKAIERYLKTGNMNEEELSSETKIKVARD